MTVQLTAGIQNIGIAPFYLNWNVQLAIIDSATNAVIEKIPVKADLQKLGPGASITLQGQGRTSLNSNKKYQLALRICQPEADLQRAEAWPLDARNVYVELANDIEIIEGHWHPNTHGLEGGWHVLGLIQFAPAHLLFEGDDFPFNGSARPYSPDSN